MEFTSKNMYDTFKDEIWKELGPLDPNWFEVLTAQMSADEGSASDQEDLCANQEGNFKATLDKTDVDSQLFSTPKVFRYGRIVSPQTEDEHSFTEQEKGTLPWMATHSPHVFAVSKQGVTDLKYGGLDPRSEISFDFLRTPRKSPSSYAKHISESLGAQINPDFSWTSSLNTPPAVPSTLILSKNETSPCPASISAEENVVFVRKLFPSLSNPSKASVIPPWRSEIPPVLQGNTGQLTSKDGVHWKKKEDEGVHIDAAAGPKLCSGLRTQLEERQAEDPRRKSLNTAQPSLHTSGFKTASNKGIHISSANLERAKLLLEEAESGKTFNSHSTKSDSAVNQQMSRSNKSGFIVSNSHQSPSLGGLEDAGCHLTESQKADVTELCTLLEEAESQFEFTQFKTAEMKQNSQGPVTSPPKTEKELDADLLAGIDFDDSFPSDADRQPASAGTPDRVTSGTNKTKCGASDSPGESESVSDELKKVHPCDEGGPSSSVHVSEGRTCVISTKPLNLHRAGNTETSRNPSALGVSFKSAGGNILTVSKAGLSRARALFADLEKLTDLKSADGQVDTKQNHSMDSSVREEVTLKDKRVPRDKDAPESFNNCKTATATCQSGFHKASGKAISVSAKYIQQAHALFKDCDIPEHDSRISVKESKSSGPVAESIKKSSMMKSSLSDERTSGIGVGCNGTLIPQNPVSTSKSASSPPCWSSKSIDSSSIDGLIKADGFHTASGKKVTVSSDSLRRAEYLLKEHSAPEDTYEERSHRNPGQRSSSGLKTPGGKGVAISSTALKKAKALMRGSHDVEDNFSEKPPQRQTPIPGPPPGKGGFVSASGKPVALSSEALLKAKALFSDISLSVDVPPNSDTKTSDGKQAYMENINKTYPDLKAPVDENVQGSQFSLLKAKVDDSVSAKAMQEAGGFVKDSMDRSDRIPLKPEKNEAYLKNKSSSGLRSGQKVTVNISGEPGNGCIKAINGQMKQKAETLPRQNGGFQTASGTTLTVSSEALSKARTLLSECEEVGSEISASPPHFKVSLPGPSSRSRGFQAASGKRVSVSSESLQRARALFSDIQAVSDTRTSDKKEKSDMDGSTIEKNLSKAQSDQRGAANISEVGEKTFIEGKNKHKKQIANAFPPLGGGFQTASGKGVAVSSEALRKAETLLSEYEGLEDESMGFLPPFKAPASSLLPRNNGFLAASGKHVAVSSEALQRAKALFSDIDLSADIQAVSAPRTSDNKQDKGENTEKMHRGFTTARGEKVHVSQKSLLKAKHLLKEFDDSVCTAEMQEADCLTKDYGMDGKYNIQPENGFSEDANKQVKQKSNTLPPQSNGFQTACGKEATVSSEAPRKARNLSKSEGAEDRMGAAPPHFKLPLPGPSSRNCGFQAASGKQVSVSSEALQRARALFSDIGLSQDIQTVSDCNKQDGGEKPQMFSGFTTAGGAKGHVQVSIDRHDLLNLDRSIEKRLNHLIPGENNRSTNECASLGGKSFNSAHENKAAEGSTEVPVEFQDTVTPAKVVDRHLSPGLEKLNVNQSSCRREAKVPRAKEFSLVNFQSLHLTGCTETQQDFLAQEAFDCTKALLEDESLSGQGFSPTSEFMQFPESPNSSSRSSKGNNGKGKRALLHDDLAGQPPLKRQLLEQFDKSVNRSRSSSLQPMKSCPNDDRDRGVFKYSDSLQPNVTRPHRSGKHHEEDKLESTNQASASGDNKSAPSKMPAFVPPFIKNARTDSCGNTAAKDKTRAAAFVPPFKKQRSNPQENASKLQQEDQDEELRRVVKSSDSSTSAPPTKKTDEATSEALVNDPVRPVEGGSADSSCVHETLSTSRDFYQNLQNTELARDMQDMRIRKKKRQTIRPLPGSLFLTKTSGVAKVPLKAAVNGKAPGRYTPKELYGHGVHWHVSEITSETAGSFRFNLLQFIQPDALAEGGGVQLGDGGWLIPRNDGTAGKEEFYRALCDTPGVDPKLLSEAWVFNHYRWIVWKQASMEKSFPETMGSLCLTPEQVLLQLKYRYDVEVDRSRRPALRKVLEKDDTAAKTLVLCVSGIASMGLSPNKNAKTPQGADAKLQSPPAVVWLTDGWYAIRAQLDEPLTAMLHRGRLAVGGKLIVHGAQLAGVQDACPPLEAPESAMLKISANSCRPVRWDVKLGFYKDPRPFLLPVSSLYTSGGPVGCVDILILRSYPIQWMERKPDGGVVFRSVRAEEKEARRHSSHKQRAMETLFAKIQAEFEQEEKGNIKPQRRHPPRNYQDITALQEGEELYEAVGDDPAYLEAHLSEHQLEALRAYQHSLMEKKQRELQDRCRRALEAEDGEMKCPKRDVTPVWRLCVADSLDQRSKVYQLNLWRPSADLQSLLKEGCRYKVYNLATSEGKKRSGIEHVQLTGTKKTQFQDLQASPEWLSTRFQPRVTTSFVNLQNPDFQPVCGEVDVTGYVISVVDEQGSCPAFYLADGEVNFVKVRCFSSFSQSGLEDVVKPCVLLALSNLQLRGQSMSPTPVVYAGDLTVFSTNPKEVHLQESLSKIKVQVQRQGNFFQTAEEKLSLLIKSGKPQTPAPTADTMTRVSSHKPVTSLGSFTPVNRHPPAATSSSEKDPRSLKRKRALDYLSHIPSPPPLSHLSSLASPCVNKTFNPPRRSGTLSTLKTVRAPAPKATESLQEKEWVKDEELAMIDTQALHVE
ncbi:breast cancer type 2 susceptibility protein [Salarias fasciatus]|uniref:breast cancer type 2 susceptibility protein n=1 Tax=Salarias fasciatus TaxID=181472 RepID=UPI001176E817|nr:breast cancer type 2 susceptibility protein [Salarias fasciatus]